MSTIESFVNVDTKLYETYKTAHKGTAGDDI